MIQSVLSVLILKTFDRSQSIFCDLNTSVEVLREGNFLYLLLSYVLSTFSPIKWGFFLKDFVIFVTFDYCFENTVQLWVYKVH